MKKVFMSWAFCASHDRLVGRDGEQIENLDYESYSLLRHLAGAGGKKWQAVELDIASTKASNFAE